MKKYEIMLVVDGELSEIETHDKISNLISLFNEKNCINFTKKVIWNDQLAYSIKKKTIGHRFLFNFETNDLNLIKEFDRLVIINNGVLRHLIICEEKNYAFKTLHNPKKIKSAEFRQRKFQEYLANKKREAILQESRNVVNANVTEAQMRKVRDYKGLDTHSTDTKTLEEEAKIKPDNFNSEKV